MGSFIKGMTFTMEGREYEVLREGTDEPSSNLVYVPSEARDTADPLTLRSWKAEARLARGDILISGFSDEVRQLDDLPPVTDPLEQIAELKKRIHAIEQRRLTLLKIDDPKGKVLLQDNVIRPNKPFDLWAYTRSSGDIAKRARKIQYIKLRGLVLFLSNNNVTERFLFNIDDQLQPSCRVIGDALISEGGIRIDLNSRIQTLQGHKTRLLADNLRGRIELVIELRVNCKFASGQMTVNAKIINANYMREINSAAFKINHLDFPEIGEHMIAVEGVAVEIYTDSAN